MINKELLKQHLENGLVFRQKHPEFDLWVYNYADKCQYEKTWDEVTLSCRGLILDEDYNVVAKGFNKFFNIQEHQPEEIPNEEFEVFEKMDGSLITIFYYNNEWIIASRGSFMSDQALKAKELIKKYDLNKLDKNLTYCLEILYPENRIVVNYGDYEALVLLAAFNPKTKEELSYNELFKMQNFDVVKSYDGINDLEYLKTLEENNKEGFVIRFKSGFRVKMKFSEYIRLHRIITGVSTVTIWEYLSQNKPFDELLSKVPDEFYDWVKATQVELNEKYKLIEKNALYVYDIAIKDKGYSRKEIALMLPPLCSKLQASIIFKIIDNKDYSNIIWKYIKPEYSKAFVLNKEEN